MRRLATAIATGLLVLGLMLIPACGGGGGGGGSSRSMVGTWVCIDSSIDGQVGTTLVLREDNTGTWDGDPITYSHGEGVMIITGMGSTTYVLEWVSDTRFIITLGEMSFTFVKT